jgi:hypothetical protein
MLPASYAINIALMTVSSPEPPSHPKIRNIAKVALGAIPVKFYDNIN